jgi:hypothetical protein
VFAGAATYGLSRPDIGQTYGSQFTNSGYTLTVRGLTPALYDLVVYARSTVTGTFNQSRVRRVTLQANPRMNVDAPAWGATVSQPFHLGGWAIDLAAASGTGVNTIHVWAYPNPGSGQAPLWVGVPTYGGPRPDVAGAFGSAQFTNSGFGMSVTGLPAGTYQLVVYTSDVMSSAVARSRIRRLTKEYTRPTYRSCRSTNRAGSACAASIRARSGRVQVPPVAPSISTTMTVAIGSHIGLGTTRCGRPLSILISIGTPPSRR